MRIARGASGTINKLPRGNCNLSDLGPTKVPQKSLHFRAASHRGAVGVLELMDLEGGGGK